MPADPILEVRDIRKVFPGTVALDGVSLAVLPGEVHGLIGENGAGKSTLMRILAGAAAPTSGTVLVHGQPVELRNVREARDRGIVMVYQELENVPVLSVAENLFLGRLPRGRSGVFIDTRRLYAEAAELLQRYGLDVNPRQRMSSLSTAHQQLVEIVKAVSVADARVIIMDEPTSSLTARETERLFEIIGRLRSRGISVIYISHRLDEITELADRVTVLRDGRNQGTLERAELDRRKLVSLMIGHDLKTTVKPRLAEYRPVLEIKDLSIAGKIDRFSARLYRGEILGIAGLVGSGKDELVKGLFGLWPLRSGEITLEGERLRIRSPRDAIRRGMLYLPEERKEQSVFAPLSVIDNITATWLAFHNGPFWGRRRAERALAAELCAALNVKTPSGATPAGHLSGGNQQKVILARLLALSPRILVLNDPTRGVDIGSKEEIHGIIRGLAAQGTSIIVLSSEIPELEYLAHRVIVLSRGEICGEFEEGTMSAEAILACATRAAS